MSKDLLNLAIMIFQSECEKYRDCDECPLYGYCGESIHIWERMEEDNE